MSDTAKHTHAHFIVKDVTSERNYFSKFKNDLLSEWLKDFQPLSSDPLLSTAKCTHVYFVAKDVSYNVTYISLAL